MTDNPVVVDSEASMWTAAARANQGEGTGVSSEPQFHPEAPVIAPAPVPEVAPELLKPPPLAVPIELLSPPGTCLETGQWNLRQEQELSGDLPVHRVRIVVRGDVMREGDDRHVGADEPCGLPEIGLMVDSLIRRVILPLHSQLVDLSIIFTGDVPETNA